MVGLSDCGGIEKGAQWRPGALGMRLGGAKAFFQTAPKRNAAAWPHRAAIAAKRPLRRYWTSQPSTTSASAVGVRSEEHTSELQSLMRISYAVFCLKKKNKDINHKPSTEDTTCI